MDIDATKAPRTHATWKKAYDAQELAKLMVELSVQLEVELNVATVNEVFAENKVHILEKELKQAQDRIKERDEWNEKLDEIIDRLTEKIILLNEIRHEAGVQDANLREKLSAANERIKRLEDWKQSALEIEREWDANAVATMLGAKLGESQRKVIQREVPLLLERIKRLEEALSLITINCEDVHHSKKHRHGWSEPCPVVELISKAKEAKP